MRRVLIASMAVSAAALLQTGARSVTAAAGGPQAAQSQTATTHAVASAKWWSHIEALANDAMEGRNTGTPAHKRAAEYVAAQFQKAGLEPAGGKTPGSYIQPVSLKTRRIVEAESSLALVRDGRAEPLALGDDANFNLRIDPAPFVDAPLVFVGYGLNISEQRINDLEDLDLKGAVVVYIAATPRSLPAPLQAHFGAAAERWKAYKAAGAIGTISIANPKAMDIPWSRSALARLQPQMALADPSLDDAPGQQVAVTMNPAHADKLFAGTKYTFGDLLQLDDDGKALPHFALPGRIRAAMRVERSEVESQNVVGLLRGSDPVRRDELVVLSAHLDHLGVGEPINGDSIYNGAMDNASGVAAILEVAAELRDMNVKPARSIVFVAVTGEEKGELGSRYFAAHPPVRPGAIVANVNTDMFLPLFPLKILMALGVDESDLGRDIRSVAREMGLTVQSDPEPQRNRFIRSDQYSFVKAGIPALAMKVGYELHTPEAAIAAKWTAERYHAPSDDLNQPVDLAAAGIYVEVVRNLAVRIANRADRPQWNDSSFFKRFAADGGSHQQ